MDRIMGRYIVLRAEMGLRFAVRDSAAQGVVSVIGV